LSVIKSGLVLKMWPQNMMRSGRIRMLIRIYDGCKTKNSFSVKKGDKCEN